MTFHPREPLMAGEEEGKKKKEMVRIADEPPVSKKRKTNGIFGAKVSPLT